jgi:hypothetical protein
MVKAQRFQDCAMIDAKILQRALIVGTLLQVTMAVLGHYSPWIRDNAFMFGGMMISATAGYLYAMDLAGGYQRGALGGAIVGGICMLIGVSASVLMKDMAPSDLAFKTGISILTGAVGGVFGQLAARMS